MTKAVLVIDGKKACGRADCQEANSQPVANFNRSGKSPSGLRSYCRSCEKRQRQRLEAIERDRVRNKSRYARDGGQFRQKALDWYYANRNSAIARITAAQAADRERVNERFRQYRAEGRYRHHDRAHAAKRRAQLAKVPADAIDLNVLYERDRGLCQLCQRPVDRSIRWPAAESESIDHVVPVSRGGGHVWANVQLAHLLCNMRKGAR